MDTGNMNRRCTDCQEHSGVIAELGAGRDVMKRLEESVSELRKDFTEHVNSSSKSTIALLIGILMCFLTGVVGIYVNSQRPKDAYSAQAEMTMFARELTKAIIEAKK